MRDLVKARGSKTLYLRPDDHAFANGPVFARPASLRATRQLFDRKEDGDLLWRIFAAFDKHTIAGDGLRLGLRARIVSKNPQPAVAIGSNCAIRGIIRCEPGGRIEIGDMVYVGDDAIISAQSEIAIGSLTLVAHGVQIFDNDTHPLDAAEREAHFKAILGLPSDRRYKISAKPIRIGRSCWLGFNSAVMKGVAIADELIVATHAVVIDDVPPRSVVAGNPARVVKGLATV